MRTLIHLFLSIALTLTGFSAASARGASPAVDQVVICIGASAVLVHIDADGQPTHTPHLCPDCALHVVSGNAAPWANPVAVTFQALTANFQTAQLATPRLARSVLARAPPA